MLWWFRDVRDSPALPCPPSLERHKISKPPAHNIEQTRASRVPSISAPHAPGRTQCTSNNPEPPAPPPPGASCGRGTACPARSFAAAVARRGGRVGDFCMAALPAASSITGGEGAARRTPELLLYLARATAHLHLAAHRYAAPALNAPAVRGARAAPQNRTREGGRGWAEAWQLRAARSWPSTLYSRPRGNLFIPPTEQVR